MHKLDLSQLPVDAHIIVGVLGVVLLVAGARLYRLTIVAPGVAAGVLIAMQLTAGAAPRTQAIAALALGLIGGGVLHFVERLAISVAGGALVAGLVNAAAPLLMPAPVPWYVPVAGGLLGLLLFPRLYKAALPLITAGLGALGIGWALQQPQHLPLLGGLALVGLIIQILTRPGKRRAD